MNKRFIILAVFLIILSLSTYAANATAPPLCSDTDSGGASAKDAAIKQLGEVKYGITKLSDTCLTSEDGVSTNSSKWLREYICENDKRVGKVYDCTRYGFTGCENGACAGASSSASSSSSGSSTSTQESSCGNKITEKAKGEDCDPPNKICFGKTSKQYGLCGPDCKCKIAGAAEKPEAVCGDGTLDSGEDCENDKDCPTNFLCSSCKCVKQLTPEEIEAMKHSKGSSSDKTPAEKIDEQYKAPPSHDVNLSVTNFSDEPAFKATSGIVGFFKSVFSWISSLFG